MALNHLVSENSGKMAKCGVNGNIESGSIAIINGVAYRKRNQLSFAYQSGSGTAAWRLMASSGSGGNRVSGSAHSMAKYGGHIDDESVSAAIALVKREKRIINNARVWHEEIGGGVPAK